MFIAFGTGLRQQEASGERDEQHAGQHDGSAQGREIEQLKWADSRLCHRFTDQQVRRRADQRHEAAEQRGVRERHQQPRRSDTRTPRHVNDNRQHQRGHADVVHESREHGTGDHDDEDHRYLALPSDAHDLSPDDVGDPGSGQTLAQDKHGPDRDYSAVAEAGECLRGVNEARYGKRAQDQKRDKVHANHLTDEEDQRNCQDSKDQCDFEGH